MISKYSLACAQSILILLCCIVIVSGIIVSGINAQQYTAQIGDTITVTVRDQEWLSGTRVVAIDGQIIFPKPIGAVKVLGLTTDQITHLLTERLEATIVDPSVFVLISEVARFTVHITGEVRSPDSFDVAKGTSLQEAITKAGGFTTFSNKKQIKIVRKDGGQTDTVELIVDLTEFEKNTDRTSNPSLKPGDVVVVPRLLKSERLVIMVIGAVNQPGAVSIEEPLFLVDVLFQAGGLTANADLKQISILRPGGAEYARQHINLEGFLTGADSSENPTVFPGETVFVPYTQPDRYVVNVVGAVIKPGIYPLHDAGRLIDAIYAAGGFAVNAAIDKVSIVRPSTLNSEKIEVNVKNYLKTSDLKYNPLLESGDTVFIPIQEDITKQVSGVQTAFVESMHVTIMGEVKRPETYQVLKEATVLEVLNLAGGPTPLADLGQVTILRANIQIELDLEKVLQEGELQSFPPLQADDTIRVPKVKQRVSTLRSALSLARDAASIISVFLLISGRLR